MAAQHFSPALRAPEVPAPHRAARTGYGKQSVPAQGPARPADFAALPERERYVAGYLDRLPDGAAMDIKSLAKDLPCTARWPSAPPCARSPWPVTCAAYAVGSMSRGTAGAGG